MKLLFSVFREWDRFFFAPVSMLPMACFRISLSATLLVMYGLRFLDWRFYFTDEGFLPAAKALEILPQVMRPVFAWYPTTDAAVLSMHGLLLVALLFLLLGIWGRFAAFTAFVLHLAFMQRNITIAYGADVVTTFFLFALIFADSGRYLSVFGFRKNRRENTMNEIFSTVGVRLVQIQTCIIYGFTGLEKLKGPSWWDATAVWAVIGNQQIMLFDFTWIKHFPLAIAAMTYSTVLWEIYFPALVWVRPLRKWVLLFGVLLHFMIGITVGLFFFSLIMVSSYLVFVNPDWLKKKLRAA